MITAGTDSTITPSFQGSTGGLVGTVGVRILNSSGTTVKARTTSGIAEPIASSGFYFASIDLSTITNPLVPGRYYVFWDDGSVTPTHIATEDLILHVTTTFASALRQIGAVEATHNAENVAVALIVG